MGRDLFWFVAFFALKVCALLKPANIFAGCMLKLVVLHPTRRTASCDFMSVLVLFPAPVSTRVLVPVPVPVLVLVRATL